MSTHIFSVELTRRNLSILENSPLINDKRFNILNLDEKPEDEVIHITIDCNDKMAVIFGKVLINSGMNYARIKR